MTNSNNEAQKRWQQKQKSLGRKELRAIWLTESEEKVIKPDIRDKLKRMRAVTYEPIEE